MVNLAFFILGALTVIACQYYFRQDLYFRKRLGPPSQPDTSTYPTSPPTLKFDQSIPVRHIEVERRSQDSSRINPKDQTLSSFVIDHDFIPTRDEPEYCAYILDALTWSAEAAVPRCGQPRHLHRQGNAKPV